MSLSSYDILETDAVIIIGLVLLLTFQSITSSFIENDIQTYFEDLRSLYIEQNEIDLLLVDCYDFITDQEEFKQRIKDYYTLDLSHYNISRDETIALIPEVSSQFLDSFDQRCQDAPIRGIEIANSIVAMENWGRDLGYLTSDYQSSDYFKDVTSGPVSVVLINLAMITPFAISAIIESIYARNKHEDDDIASKWGLWLMIVGFAVLIVGFIIIGIIFLKTNLIFY